MPEGSFDTSEAEKEAALASAFFDRLVRDGKSEQIAAQLTTAWILGRLRLDDKREDWDAR